MKIDKERLQELLTLLSIKEKLDFDEGKKKKILWAFAIIGAVAAICLIAFAVYRFFAPDYLEDFEDDFDEDFDDYFEEETEQA